MKPDSHKVSLHDLAAQGRPCHFMYEGTIYSWTLDMEPISKAQEGTYLAMALGTTVPTRFPGSTLVTPFMPKQPLPGKRQTGGTPTSPGGSSC